MLLSRRAAKATGGVGEILRHDVVEQCYAGEHYANLTSNTPWRLISRICRQVVVVIVRVEPLTELLKLPSHLMFPCTCNCFCAAGVRSQGGPAV